MEIAGAVSFAGHQPLRRRSSQPQGDQDGVQRGLHSGRRRGAPAPCRPPCHGPAPLSVNPRVLFKTDFFSSISSSPNFFHFLIASCLSSKGFCLFKYINSRLSSAQASCPHQLLGSSPLFMLFFYTELPKATNMGSGLDQ